MLENLSTVQQGTVGVGAAVYEFTKRNWCVSIPVNDIQAYDLVVDDGTDLKKVQVKTTRFMPKGCYVVQLKSVRPNRTTNIIKQIDNTSFDYLFVLCADESKYLIPSESITAKNSINLGNRFAKYKL